MSRARPGPKRGPQTDARGTQHVACLDHHIAGVNFLALQPNMLARMRFVFEGHG